MPDLRKVLAAGLLQGLGTGMDRVADMKEQDVRDDHDIRKAIALRALTGDDKSTFQRDYEYWNGLPEEQRDEALRFKSSGNTMLAPNGEINRNWKPPKKKDPGSSNEEISY